MKKILKYNLIALLAMVFFMYSCDDDDYTGYSDLTATSPSITVSGIAGGGYTLNESAQTEYTFDVTLSEAQISDVALYVTQVGGDAENGADFSISNTNSRVLIPANSTTGQLGIKVLTDELIEGTETFTLQIGDERTANTSITPVTVTWTINNYTVDALDLTMSWETDVADVIGLDIDPDEVGDLMLFIYDNTDALIETIDGGSFETYSGMDTLPDGDYKIAAGFYSTIDAGDFNEAITFDVSLHLYQAGVMDETYVLEDVFDNLFPCYDFRTYLGTVTKLGSTYTWTEDIVYSVPARTTWYGLDSYFEYEDEDDLGNPITVHIDYPSVVETAPGCNGELLIYGLNHEWMYDFWGETVVEEGHVRYEINEYTNEITIAEQYCFTTDYDGDLYDYTITGTGIYDDSGTYPTMVINYELDQDGFSPSGWAYDNGYQTEEYFTATLTLDPAGKNVVNSITEKKFDLSMKPY